MPGVDDGAQSLQEALALCRLAVADGTQVAVATPHARGRGGVWTEHLAPAPGPRGAGPNGPQPEAAGITAAQVEAWTSALQRELDAQGIPLRLVAGMETLFDADLPSRAPSLVTLGGTRYLLLEFPAWMVPPGAAEVIFRLQAAGLVPVIAHPERNDEIARRPELLEELVQRGCLVQVTAMSLTGGFGSAAHATATALLQAGLAHVIASDAHSYPWRPTGLSEAVAEAARVVGEAQARAMVTSIPRAILENREVAVRPPSPARRRRRPRRFWSIW